MDKIEPQNIHACLFRSQIKGPRSTLNAYDSKDYKGRPKYNTMKSRVAYYRFI